MSSESLRRPPSADGLGTGSVLALLVHLGLIAALAWGVSWRRHDATPVTAELWSAVPRLADAPAPAPVAPPPPPPKPVPPKPVVEAKPAPPQPKEADIAVEKKPKKKDKEEPKKEEPKKPEPPKKDKEAEKKLEDKKKAEAQAREQAAEHAKEQARQDKAQAERAQKAREEQMRRLNAQLGTGTGAAAGSGGGNAAQASAPSASYAGRIRARVKPNIIFSGPISGNPRAEVEVRVEPDGNIISSKLIKSSGQPEWDQAVLRAVERTEVLPRDTDGRVPALMVLTFSPQDF
ncbi:MAG: cell envelope integrity protein TolA [Burkholderiales bacterium]